MSRLEYVGTCSAVGSISSCHCVRSSESWAISSVMVVAWSRDSKKSLMLSDSAAMRSSMFCGVSTWRGTAVVIVSAHLLLRLVREVSGIRLQQQSGVWRAAAADLFRLRALRSGKSVVQE